MCPYSVLGIRPMPHCAGLPLRGPLEAHLEGAACLGVRVYRQAKENMCPLTRVITKNALHVHGRVCACAMCGCVHACVRAWVCVGAYALYVINLSLFAYCVSTESTQSIVYAYCSISLTRTIKGPMCD